MTATAKSTTPTLLSPATSTRKAPARGVPVEFFGTVLSLVVADAFVSILAKSAFPTLPNAMLVVLVLPEPTGEVTVPPVDPAVVVRPAPALPTPSTFEVDSGTGSVARLIVGPEQSGVLPHKPLPVTVSGQQ